MPMASAPTATKIQPDFKRGIEGPCRGKGIHRVIQLASVFGRSGFWEEAQCRS
jgi:hypothetical protein